MGIFSWMQQQTTESAFSSVPLNPATNLPMQNDIFDVHGNPHGMDLHGGFPPINPPTGLPMNGMSGVDIGGNPFGVNLNDPFST